jgi:hypothetical protein
MNTEQNSNKKLIITIVVAILAALLLGSCIYILLGLTSKKNDTDTADNSVSSSDAVSNGINIDTSVGSRISAIDMDTLNHRANLRYYGIQDILHYLAATVVYLESNDDPVNIRPDFSDATWLWMVILQAQDFGVDCPKRIINSASNDGLALPMSCIPDAQAEDFATSRFGIDNPREVLKNSAYKYFEDSEWGSFYVSDLGMYTAEMGLYGQHYVVTDIVEQGERLILTLAQTERAQDGQDPFGPLDWQYNITGQFELTVSNPRSKDSSGPMRLISESVKLKG